MTDPAPDIAPDIRLKIEELFHTGYTFDQVVERGWPREDVLTVLRLNGWDLDGSGRLPRSKRTTVPRGLRSLPPAPAAPKTKTTSRHRTGDGITRPPHAEPSPGITVPPAGERWLPPVDDPRLPKLAASVIVKASSTAEEAASPPEMSGDTIARASEIRAQVDAMTPRSVEGEVNAQHVAIEQTLRERHGLPSYVAELDGPGNFLPTPPLPRQRPPAPLAHRGRRPDGRDLDDWLDEACRDDRAHVRRAAERACLLHEQLHDALDDLVRAEHNR